MLELVGIEQELCEKLNLKVDILTQNSVSPYILPYIEKEVKVIYKSNEVYLQHILDAILRIEEYTKDTEYNGFIASNLIQSATIRELEIIGEAVKRLTEDFKKLHPDVPWKSIAGMRDKLIYDYFGVDIDAVWETLRKDIPNLKEYIKNILNG